MTIGANALIEFFGVQDAVTTTGGSTAHEAFTSAGQWTNDDDAPEAGAVLVAQWATATSIAGKPINLYGRLHNIQSTNDAPAPSSTNPVVFLGTFIAPESTGSTDFYMPLSTDQASDLLRVRREEDVIRANGEGDWSDPAIIVDRLRDPQLAAALRAVQARIDTGEWERTGQPGPEREAIALDELRRIQRTRDLMLRELGRLEQRITAIETAVPDAAARAQRDFWSDDLELAGGTLDVFDPDGNRVVRLRITADDLERWLLDAPLEPAE